MAYYSEEIIDEVKSANDIVDVLFLALVRFIGRKHLLLLLHQINKFTIALAVAKAEMLFALL